MANRAEKIAALVEKHLRKDLNLSSQVPYQILSPESGGLPPQSLLMGYVAGRVQVHQIQLQGLLQKTKDLDPMCYVYFNLSQPRRFELQAFIYNPGLVTEIHRLAYAVPLSKPVRDPVQVLDPRVTVFSGDADAAARLNRNPQLLKQASALAITERETSGYPLLIDRRLAVYPAATGSLFILHTLPKTLMMRQTLLANETLQLASAIEATL